MSHKTRDRRLAMMILARAYPPVECLGGPLSGNREPEKRARLRVMGFSARCRSRQLHQVQLSSRFL